jgi:hypothetical protein
MYLGLMVGRKNQSINVPEVFQEVKDGGEPEMLYTALTVRIDGEPKVLGPTLQTARFKERMSRDEYYFHAYTIITLFPLCSLEILFFAEFFS